MWQLRIREVDLLVRPIYTANCAAHFADPEELNILQYAKPLYFRPSIVFILLKHHLNFGERYLNIVIGSGFKDQMVYSLTIDEQTSNQ